MTECYVIKNKDGQYLRGLEEEYLTKDLSEALFYDENEKNIMKKAYPEYSFVKIIVGESDELCSKIFKSTIGTSPNNQIDITNSMYIRDEVVEERKRLIKEIRETLNNHCEYMQGREYNGWYLSEAKLNNLLDKIEIGVKNEE